jgi:hypothetical protein
MLTWCDDLHMNSNVSFWFLAKWWCIAKWLFEECKIWYWLSHNYSLIPYIQIFHPLNDWGNSRAFVKALATEIFTFFFLLKKYRQNQLEIRPKVYKLIDGFVGRWGVLCSMMKDLSWLLLIWQLTSYLADFLKDFCNIILHFKSCERAAFLFWQFKWVRQQHWRNTPWGLYPWLEVIWIFD